MDLYEESLVPLRELGNPATIGNVLNNIGDVVQAQGDYARATAPYEEGLALFREIGDRTYIAISLVNLGEIACLRRVTMRGRALSTRSVWPRSKRLV